MAALSNFGLPQLSTAGNNFSIDLYKTFILPKSPEKNAFLSPFSVLAALSMVNVGAKGTTREEILRTTHLDGNDPGKINGAFKELFSQLDTGDGFSDFDQMPPILEIANRVYVDKKSKTNNNFNTTVQEFYKTSLGTANFFGNPDEAKREINSWVEKVTHGKIKELFDDMEEDVKMVLVSAIYFKAQWDDEFPISLTAEKDFFINGQNSIKAKFLNMVDDKNSRFATFSELDATGLLKPYAYKNVHIFIILPNKKDGLTELERKLSPGLFDWQKFKPATVDISLPKFKIESDYQLNDGLKKLGIKQAFSDNADFGGLLDESTQLKISEAVHKTFISLDEKGTEAAAATGMKIEGRMMHSGPPLRKVFKADHPFLFAIQHKDTGAILFMGRVAHPTFH